MTATNASFLNQRVVVIGGSSGIGLSAAQAFVAMGAKVIVAGRSADKLSNAKKSCDQLETRALDGSIEAEVASFFEAIPVFDHLVLCANAGGTIGPFANLDMATMREYLDNKLWVYLYALKYAAGKIKPAGSITLINGAASQFAVPKMAALALVNGGLDAIVRPLALEYAPVRVNAIAPGVIDTPYWAKLQPEQRSAMYAAAARGVPVGKVGAPEDVAGAAVFLASNGFITGTVMLVDGGRHLTPNV